VKACNPSFARKPEEVIKFKSLLRMLIWVQNNAGKSSVEVVSMTLRKGQAVLDQSWNF